jgi:hypothetical protein
MGAESGAWQQVGSALFQPFSLGRALDAPERRLVLAVSLGAFALYVLALCPSIALIGDSAELATAAATRGIPHAPGYPLFVLLAQPFVALPWPDLAWRLNLSSAVYHALCVALIVRAALGLTRSLRAGLAAGLCLALSRSFLQGSLYAEVFPLNDLLCALLMTVALGIHRAKAKQATLRQLGTRLAALAALSGLAATNHQTIALTAGCLLVYSGPALVTVVKQRPLSLVRFFGAFLIPFSVVYAFVPLFAGADPGRNWGDVHDFGSLVDLITRQDYGGLLRASRHAPTEHHFERLTTFFELLFQSFGFIALTVAAAGTILWQKRRDSLALFLGFLGTGPLFAALNGLFSVDAMRALVERFLPLCHLPLALLVALGIASLETRVVLRAPVRWLLAALPALPLVVNVPEVSMHDRRIGEQFSRDLLDRVEPDALILLSGDLFTPAAEYRCLVEEDCRAATLVSPGRLFLDWYRLQVHRRHPELDGILDIHTVEQTHQLVRAELEKRPVYVQPNLVEKDPELLSSFFILPSVLLFRVYPDQAAAQQGAEAFMKTCQALADGEYAGSDLRLSDLPVPAFETPVLLAYQAALQNHAAVARKYFGAEALAERLEERARAISAKP